MKILGPVSRIAAFLLVLCVAAPLSRAAIAKSAPPKSSKRAAKASATLAAKQLEQLCRSLKQKNSGPAYAQLSLLASRKSSGALGARAALALGYYDYSKARYAQAAKWLAIAQADPLLPDYALYWSAATNLALNRNAEVLAQLKRFRHDYPDSVLTDDALQSLGAAALALNQPAEILDALDAYPPTREKPDLLFLRAEAREQSAQPLQAAADYEAVYLRFPTNEQSREAGEKLGFLRSSLGEKLPAIPVERQIEHASTIFAARQWSEARGEYSTLLPQLTGADRERAELRIMECGVAVGAGISQIAALKITDPDVDAERYYALANYYRDIPAESEMAAAIESAAARAPASRWTESALFLGGNYYWVQLDRDRAAGYYKRLSDNFPTAAEALPAQWRVTWTAVLKRQPEAAEDLTEHLRRFPGSQFTPDALYWLGRLAEESQNAGLARSYYEKLQQRFPQNYFANAAGVRMRTIGPGPETDPDVFASIPPLPPAMTVGPSIPPAAENRQARADALRSIAFDASAELELRAAYAATREPRLLLEAAQEAVSAGHMGAAIVTIRQIYPQIEWRPFDDVPREVWLTAFAMPYQSSILSRSTQAGVDPMLTAGLIRQESAYDPEARSGANARGLMQLLPKTARRFAKQARVRYSTPMLFEPDYNIHIGTIYFAGLKRDFGSVESALAAYNAGEDRVTFWTTGQTYREPAEFVDSIPFTETREYVEIVTRNADIYRKLYGAAQPARGARNESRKTGTGSGR
ncbi:MAG: transglycosylase SLT domain-containing protein [Candidatus Acidiferrales bacterium]